MKLIIMFISIEMLEMNFCVYLVMSRIEISIIVVIESDSGEL